MKVSEIKVPVFESDGDESELPQEQIDALMHELEELAKDESRDFPNALSMVHEAYRICDIERPAPSMRSAWAQYEKCMTAAVQYLAKHKPKGNWRVTTAASKT